MFTLPTVYFRSGSKVFEKGRASPAADSATVISNVTDSEHSDLVDDM